ncbi:MAG: hypothetical protein COC24_000465 [Alphaproteobacteria bacterium]|nr:hypothetical protein [Alphaproteobacteria bacterium]
MQILKKSAKFILVYLVLKWLFIGVVGWQISRTLWWQNYYANDFVWWHGLFVPATIISIFLLIKFIKSRVQNTK